MRLALVEALIKDLQSGALSISTGLKLIDFLKENGLSEAAAEIERNWGRATSAGGVSGAAKSRRQRVRAQIAPDEDGDP